MKANAEDQTVPNPQCMLRAVSDMPVYRGGAVGSKAADPALQNEPQEAATTFITKITESAYQDSASHADHQSQDMGAPTGSRLNRYNTVIGIERAEGGEEGGVGGTAAAEAIGEGPLGCGPAGQGSEPAGPNGGTEDKGPSEGGHLNGRDGGEEAFDAGHYAFFAGQDELVVPGMEAPKAPHHNDFDGSALGTFDASNFAFFSAGAGDDGLFEELGGLDEHDCDEAQLAGALEEAELGEEEEEEEEGNAGLGDLSEGLGVLSLSSCKHGHPSAAGATAPLASTTVDPQ